MDIVREIIALEWDAFQAVRNIGGRADCQDDHATFAIMRGSQLRAWASEVRDSYLNDLISARAGGRNLLEEKYARMMLVTAPLHYERLKAGLPEITDDKRKLVEEIVRIHMEWQRDYIRTYPALAGRGRISGRDGDVWGTSFETYLRGELLTYSERTLGLYLQHVQRMRARGINLNMEIMEHTARAYGYETALEAEQAIGQM